MNTLRREGLILRLRMIKNFVDFRIKIRDSANMASEEIKPDERFCVFQFFMDGSCERVRDWVSLDEAMKAAMHYTHSVAARIGTTVEVIITDAGDLRVFEWKFGQGVTFPKPPGEGS